MVRGIQPGSLRKDCLVVKSIRRQSYRSTSQGILPTVGESKKKKKYGIRDQLLPHQLFVFTVKCESGR